MLGTEEKTFSFLHAIRIRVQTRLQVHARARTRRNEEEEDEKEESFPVLLLRPNRHTSLPPWVAVKIEYCRSNTPFHNVGAVWLSATNDGEMVMADF